MTRILSKLRLLRSQILDIPWVGAPKAKVDRFEFVDGRSVDGKS